MSMAIEKKIKQRELEEAEMAKLAEKIEGTEITIKAKVGESEKLYGSVTAADIAARLADLGIELDKKKIQLKEPIKALGDFVVPVKISFQVTTEVKVQIVPVAAA